MAEGKDNPALFKDEIKLTDVNFISPELEIENKELKVRARVRYRQPLFDAVLYKLSAGSYKLIFKKPQNLSLPANLLFYILMIIKCWVAE